MHGAQSPSREHCTTKEDEERNSGTEEGLCLDAKPANSQVAANGTDVAVKRFGVCSSFFSFRWLLFFFFCITFLMLELLDGGVSRSSTWDKSRLSSSSSPSAAFSHITTVLSLAWFADHTILLLTLRGKNVYLELVSREKLHELFLLPAELANPTLFDVQVVTAQMAYVTVNNGLLFYLFQIEAITSLLVRTKHLTRSSPTSYSLSLLFIADLAQYTKALPVLTLKLFASTSAVASMPAIALLALDSSGCLYYITPTVGGWASGSNSVKEQQAESLLLLREVEDFHRLEYPHSLGTSPECLIARRGSKEVIEYLLWSPFFFTISSSFSSCLIHLSSLENGSFSGFRSGILFWNITQKISLSLQSSVEEQSTTFSASHSSSSCSYLPSFSFQPLPLSLAFLLFSESLTREDQADSILDAFLARSLDMLLTDNVAAVLFLEEAEKALKDMVSKKNFTNRDPSFQRFIATLARFSPTLMRDVIASTSRRVESSLVRYMFPLPMTSLAPCLSPTALFLSCLQPSPNLTQCARLLTIACEEDEEEEDWKNSSSSIEMSVELLLASMRHLHLPLSVEVLSFIFRLESLTVFNNDKIQRKPKKKSKASSSSGFFASLSSVLLSPLSLFVEEVEEAAETSSTQDPLEAPIKISRYGSSGNDERDEEVKWEEEILERGGEVGNSTFKRILKHLKSASHSSSSSSFSSSSSTACISTYSMALTCSLALSSLCPFSVAVLLSSFCLPSSSISPSARSSLSSLSPSTELLAQPLSYVAEGCRSRLESLLRTPALSLLYFFLSPFESLKATTESRATNQSTLLKTILSKCGFKDGYYSKAELEGMMMSTISETRLRDCCQSELSFDSNSGTMVLLSLPSFQGVRSVNSSGGEKKAALIATSLMDLSLFHTAEDCHVLTVHSLLRSLCMASILSNRCVIYRNISSFSFFNLTF